MVNDIAYEIMKAYLKWVENKIKKCLFTSMKSISRPAQLKGH